MALALDRHGRSGGTGPVALAPIPPYANRTVILVCVLAFVLRLPPESFAFVPAYFFGTVELAGPLPTGALWRGPIAAAELARRIESIHRPYHAALADALAQARERFGAAVLLDCHSMPPRSPESGEPRIVFGDLHGTSARHDLAAAAVAAAGALGYSVGRNRPYAGGHVVGRHGAPGRGIHAIQIEIDRSLYLDAALTAPGPGFGATCRLLASVAAALEAALIGESGAIAAE